jgi:carbon starvation protein
VLWVTLGTIFFAGVHDFGAIWASARNQGRSIGALSENAVGSRTRALFMVIIFLVLLMVNAVFGVVITGLFIETPSAVFPAWFAIVVALIVGQLIHRNFNLTLISIGGVAALYASIFVGSELPLALPDDLFGIAPTGQGERRGLAQFQEFHRRDGARPDTLRI